MQAFNLNPREVEEFILSFLIKNGVSSTDVIAYALEQEAKCHVDKKYLNKKLVKIEKWSGIRRVTAQQVIYWAANTDVNKEEKTTKEIITIIQ
jgi:hypothetical protein